jgi:hypothetical protein
VPGGGIIKTSSGFHEIQKEESENEAAFRLGAHPVPCNDSGNSHTQAAPDVNAQKLAAFEEGCKKAVKADDAKTPCHLWNERVWNVPHKRVQVLFFNNRFQKCPLDSLRTFLLLRWRRNVRRSLLLFLQQEHGKHWQKDPQARIDKRAGADCLHRAMGAEWWSWPLGSRLFFWRWPPSHRIAARDGYVPFIEGELPNDHRPQVGERDPEYRSKVVAKLTDVRNKGYIGKGRVDSLTSFFWVPKGDQDIRMVYDATRSGLNEVLWAPSFSMPTVDSLTRGVMSHSWMGDLDIGEMFLNFCLHPILRPFCGVDLGAYFPESCVAGKTLWERWERCMMGLRNSPYVCIKGLSIALEVVKGDRHDPNNVFAWDGVRTNLPGDAAYDPTKPRIWRFRGTPDDIASLLVSYVDDLRGAHGSKEECWLLMHRVSTWLAYLGIQMALRKIRPPTQSPGAWAGSIVITNDSGVGVQATQEKWEKVQGILNRLHESLTEGGLLHRNSLESMRGTLVYVQCTYPAITPYLKGLHLTIDSWREGRNEDGWIEDGHVSEEEREHAPGDSGGAADSGRGPQNSQASPPDFVQAVPRLAHDVHCLRQLFSSPIPPVRYVRATHICTALYGFGDASGSGFGSTFGGGEQLVFRHGIWGKDDDSSSSNFRELNNLVTTLESGVRSGYLALSEVWIFTDNFTAESVFYKGHSSSFRLNELALRLRKLEMNGDIKLNMVHIPGTRMIAQGTDGLSRGDLTEGVMHGRSMLDFIPLNRSALEHQPSLLHWIRQWLPSSDLHVLGPEDWFEKGHSILGGALDPITRAWMPEEMGDAWLLWHPPPPIAAEALEEMDSSRHKRKWLNHIFVAPRLMTFSWRKRLNKISDLVFEIPPGARDFWPHSEHEPLLIGLTLRFPARSPWQVKRAGGILELERLLREVWKDAERDERIILRQFCLSPQRLDRLSPGVVR